MSQDADLLTLKRKIEHERIGGWLMIAVGFVALGLPLLLDDAHDLLVFGAVTAMLGTAVVRSTGIMRALTSRLSEEGTP